MMTKIVCPFVKVNNLIIELQIHNPKTFLCPLVAKKIKIHKSIELRMKINSMFLHSLRCNTIHFYQIGLFFLKATEVYFTIETKYYTYLIENRKYDFLEKVSRRRKRFILYLNKFSDDEIKFAGFCLSAFLCHHINLLKCLILQKSNNKRRAFNKCLGTPCFC